jgi:hypothetical protein
MASHVDGGISVTDDKLLTPFAIKMISFRLAVADTAASTACGGNDYSEGYRGFTNRWATYTCDGAVGKSRGLSHTYDSRSKWGVDGADFDQ